MANVNQILEMDKDSFRVNQYSKRPFRAIGLINVKMKFNYGIENVTLAYYRSSGTNDGKVKGLWYPIVGIKLKEGEFNEFTDYINYILSNTTLDGTAIKGWLCKSVFFGELGDKSKNPGFSNTKHYDFLLDIGETLKYLYENGKYNKMKNLDSNKLNESISSLEIYEGNKHTQRENFEKFVQDIYNQFK
ncbi:hypothetical protein [Romboutsia lituseburensis]|uniref:hypothetical protein n=1 Tax=Romboutsia lituseburensis TaxID=1537 RepID=UPI00215A93B5|nr:hypothetical protein [Romboutsia lituseburensis]